MKKLFYILAIAVASSLVITGCTDEEVAPKTATAPPGGGHLFDE